MRERRARLALIPRLEGVEKQKLIEEAMICAGRLEVGGSLRLVARIEIALVLEGASDAHT